MLMIRFQRIGRKNDPAFRMVVLPKSAGPKAGKYVELVGSYNPRTKAMTVNGDAIKGWIAKGAQVSPSLKNLLITKGILEGKKENVLPKKTRIVTEQPAEAAPAAAPAAEAVAVVEETGEEVPVAEVVDAPEEVAEVAAEDAAAEVKEEAPAA